MVQVSKALCDASICRTGSPGRPASADDENKIEHENDSCFMASASPNYLITLATPPTGVHRSGFLAGLEWSLVLLYTDAVSLVLLLKDVLPLPAGSHWKRTLAVPVSAFSSSVACVKRDIIALETGL